MAYAEFECFRGLLINSREGVQVPDGCLGRVKIATLSTDVQTVELPEGTNVVGINTDSAADVYFNYGGSDVTVDTTSTGTAVGMRLAIVAGVPSRFTGVNGGTHAAAMST